MTVGVDDRRHRLIGDRLDGLQNRLPPPRQLGINQHHAVLLGDERSGVPTAAADDIQILADVHRLDRH
jgi:hypothetical protein